MEGSWGGVVEREKQAEEVRKCPTNTFLWVRQGASRLSSHKSETHQGKYEPFFSPFSSETIFFFRLCIHRKLYSPNKTLKQSRFTVNLIKAACLRRIPLCTAKSNLLSIRFTQRSIYLHWRLLGTICGYLGLGERGRNGREDGASKVRREKIKGCRGKIKEGRAKEWEQTVVEERETEGRTWEETTMITGENLSIKYPISLLKSTHRRHNYSVISVIAIMSLVTLPQIDCTKLQLRVPLKLHYRKAIRLVNAVVIILITAFHGEKSSGNTPVTHTANCVTFAWVPRTFQREMLSSPLSPEVHLQFFLILWAFWAGEGSKYFGRYGLIFRSVLQFHHVALQLYRGEVGKKKKKRTPPGFK